MSSQSSEQYRQFLNRLQGEEDRPAALNDIKNLFVYKTAGEVSNTIRDVGISKIVHCLNVPDKSQVDLSCEILRICFEKCDTGDIVKNYTGHIMYLLRHEKPCVRRLAVDEVYKTVMTDINILPIPQYIDVFVAVAQMVCDEDVGVANKAILITSALPNSAYPKILEEMKIALQCTTSSKCNACEVVVNISQKSYELLHLSAEQGYIDFMLSELQSDDVLYQLNILELLSRLAVTPHGISYMVKQGSLTSISNWVAEIQDNPLVGLLRPGYMKFFGNIAHHYPREIIEKYPFLLDSMFDSLASADQTVMPVALDTLGYIGSSIEGKLCLAALGSKYTEAIDHVTQMIRNSPTDLKIRALHCFANLISIDRDPASRSGPIDQRVTLMTREWFRSLSGSPVAMETVYSLCKNPFPDIRQAAIGLLDAVCQHQWGMESVARTAGLIEYLLDRKVDHSKECKEAKFEVIKKLRYSTAFDESTLQRLQLYVEQGPFFSETMLQVAMEEEN